ncbi:asparaginase [Kineosporia rhizophila]|uniref:asparaginase n=1 Tax=Kineosporia TaxID=49184 RepID=UPI001E390085|nr:MULTISPECIES: asparaginase [Kineosporia]MCE0539256.1 asparaginase [Kineosporia rhizophila]GLY14473.1 L-asparaginase [Kineosporia sp. NBRC 101677]
MTKVLLITLGGTISSSGEGGTPGVIPRSGADELAGQLAPYLPHVQVIPHELRLLPSPSLGFADLFALLERIAEARDVAGIVVSQGTDTLEETAFFLDVLGAGEQRPVVVTGAMRDRDTPGADGAANLIAAVNVASSPLASGVLVVFADRIFSGRTVRKDSAVHADAFTASPWGALGLVREGDVHLQLSAGRAPTLKVPLDVDAPQVALISTGVDDDLRLLPELARFGYAGVVLEGMGGGHVAARAIPAVEACPLPVVLCSRAGAGPTLRRTYGYRGGEIDLLGRGLIWGGHLTGVKARILLILCLMHGLSGDALQERFEQIANS